MHACAGDLEEDDSWKAGGPAKRERGEGSAGRIPLPIQYPHVTPV